MSSTSYELGSTLGQPSVVGVSTSANYINQQGFWYTIPEPPDLTPASVPSNIEANDLGTCGEVFVSWNDPADADFDHVVIYRSISPGTLGSVVADNQTGQSYVDTSVVEDVTYYYTVRSVDTVGNESTNTTQVSVTAGNCPPGEPTGVSALDNGNGGEVDLGWTNPVDSDFACVNVYRSFSLGNLGELVGDCVAGTSWADTGLTNGVEYFYTLRAQDSDGAESGDSSQESATPSQTGDVSAAGEVSDIVFDNPADGFSLTLGWTNPADLDLAFALIYRSTDGSKGELIDGVDLQGQSGAMSAAWWTDENVQGCTTYYYTIATLDDSGNESTGVQASHAVTDTLAPLPVTGLTATPLANHEIQLDWLPSGSVDANCYQPYYNSGTLTALGGCLADPTATYSTGSMSADTTYNLVVRTEANCGPNDENNNEVSATTVLDPDAGNACSAWIKVPNVGHAVCGNSVTIKADTECSGTATISDVLFEYSDDDGSSWTSVVPKLAGETNADADFPYMVHWDTTDVLVTDGDYLLRAVANGNTTPEPGTVAIAISNDTPGACQANENNNAGKQQKEEPTYQGAPSSSSMGDDEGETRIEVPEDSLNEDTTVVIEDVDTPPTAPPADFKDTGKYKDIHFGNGQGQLNNDKKANVYLSYTDDDNDGYVDGSSPPISIYDLEVCNDHNNEWTCLNSTIDKANKQIKGMVNKFSTFGLMVPPRPMDGMEMVSVPLTPNGSSACSVFCAYNSWGSYVYAWDPTASDYYVATTVEPGTSYWIMGNGNSLTAEGTETPEVAFTINLQKGWNMVANPFRFDVALSDLNVQVGASPQTNLATAELNGTLVGTFFTYQNGAYQTVSHQDNDVMEAWTGYWILVDEDCTLIVPPNTVE